MSKTRIEMVKELLDQVRDWSHSELVEYVTQGQDEYLDCLDDEQLRHHYELIIGEED